MTTEVSTTVDDGVLLVTLDRPAARNALSAALLPELTRVFRTEAFRTDVDVVIVTGADPAFCAGLDLRELRAAPEQLMRVATDDATNPFLALRSVDRPVIGAVNGPAVTGGLEIALACDILVASERATFADTHARVGVLPAQGLPALLSAAVGVPLAKRMSLTGEPIDAARAAATGLVDQVVPHDDLLPAARALAARIRGGNQRAIRAVKRLYDDGLRGTRSQWLALEQRMGLDWRFDETVGRQEGTR